MSVMDRKYINVLNCNDNCVAIQSVNGKGYLFEAGSLDEPFIIPIPTEEIVYINSIGKAFKNGVLRFEDDIAEEMYEALGILNTDSILFRENIDEMILNPDLEAMKRIVSITDSSQIERIRGRYYYMLNNGMDISSKVGKVIVERYKEIIAGKLHSEIQVSPAEKATDAEAKIKELQDRIAKYDALFEKMAKKLELSDDDDDEAPEPSDSVTVENNQPDEVTTKAVKSTRGRKPKADKTGK